jgi:hypothetical protein
MLSIAFLIELRIELWIELVAAALCRDVAATGAGASKHAMPATNEPIILARSVTESGGGSRKTPRARSRSRHHDTKAVRTFIDRNGVICLETARYSRLTTEHCKRPSFSQR